MRNFVQIAIDYAMDAINDKKRKTHCKLIRQAAKRFLDDLKRADKKNCPFFFDEWHANDACDFIEKLPHVEGKWDCPTIIMHPSHVFLLFNYLDLEKKKLSISKNGVLMASFIQGDILPRCLQWLEKTQKAPCHQL